MVVVRRLLWNPGNVGHIARHQVTPEQVEQVCHGEHIQAAAYAGRLMLIGPTRAGAMLAVVLEPESNDRYWVVTARLASRKERLLYRRLRGLSSDE